MGEWENEGSRIVYYGTLGCSSMRSYCDPLTTKDTDFRGVGTSTEHTVSLQIKGWLRGVDHGPVERVFGNNGTYLGL